MTLLFHSQQKFAQSPFCTAVLDTAHCDLSTRRLQLLLMSVETSSLRWELILFLRIPDLMKMAGIQSETIWGFLGYGLDDRGFESRQGLGIFLFTTVSRPALGPTQPHYPLGTRGSFHGCKEARVWSCPLTSIYCRGKKKIVALYIHSPNTPSWRGASLKRKDNFSLKKAGD
jgi:hypothetical protein